MDEKGKVVDMQCRLAVVGEQARRYVRELTEVLASLDLDRVKEFYRGWKKIMDLPPMPDNAQLEKEMHLMVLELPGLAHLHRDSQEWLLARGLTINIGEVRPAKLHHSGPGENGGRSSACGCGGGPGAHGAVDGRK